LVVVGSLLCQAAASIASLYLVGDL
jgi:hypothetical protein